MPPPLSAQQIVQSFMSDASTLPIPSDVDPNKTNVQAERYLNELEDSLAKDNTPLLQFVPRSDGVTWKTVLTLMLRESYRRLAEKESKVPKKVAVDGIAAAMRGAESARKRLIQAIDGNRSNPQRSNMLRERIFASRTLVKTKAGWEAELRSEIAAIKALGDEAPPAVVDMLDVLQSALRTLDATLAAPTGRAAKAVVWSQPVLEVAVAINLAIGDLISSAASKATPKRNASLVRLSAPKRKDEEKSDSAAEKKASTPEKKPSPTETAATAPETDSALAPPLPTQAPETAGPDPADSSTAATPPLAASQPPPSPGPVATGAGSPAPESPSVAACESNAPPPFNEAASSRPETG